jgi:hypothetical protein
VQSFVLPKKNKMNREKQSEKKTKPERRKFLRLIALTTNFSKAKVQEFLPFVFFLALLALLNIASRHNAENMARDINILKKEIKELRWDYMTNKAELMYICKQTEVALRVESLGLKESLTPPKKIVLKN